MICKAIRNFLRAKFPVKKLLRFALYLFSYRIELLAVGRQRLINMYWKRGFEMKEKGSSFSGSIGFVLAAAGSAVGVGNIWRFPYLCAKDGGGLFLLVYLVLVLTFGFVLLTTDVAIGRKTNPR